MDARGYQLVEGMLVCSLLGLLSSFALPAFRGLGDHHRLQAASQLFLSTVAGARFEALAKNTAVQVQVHADRQRFAKALRSRVPALWHDLPGGVQFSSVPNTPVAFYSRGTASPGGTFILENASGRIRVVIASSGRLRWERLN